MRRTVDVDLLSVARLLGAKAVWSVLVVALLLPAFALGDAVEIGYLLVENTCEPAPRSPAHGLICSGSVALFNETTTAIMYDVGFNVGGVTHDTPLPNEQIIGPEGGEDVQFQDFTNWYVAVPRATVLSVQADLVLGFTSVFITQDLGGPDSVAGTFNLSGGLFATEVESLPFDADFRGLVPIFVDATTVIPVIPVAAPEPGTWGFILTAIPLVFVMRKHLRLR
jgi:hypothetical protein